MKNEDNVISVVNAVHKALIEIDDVALLGDNSVVRRIRTILSRVLEPFESDLKIKSPEGIKREPPVCLQGDTLPLLDVVDEFQADDRRRSIFVDADEAILAGMIDYVSGRLKSIEFRDPNNIIDISSTRLKTRQLMRGNYPIVAINHELAEDDSEIPFLLRRLAEKIENGELKIKSRQCAQRTESLGTRWVNNGRTLEEGHRVVEKCCSRDKCCGNQTCGEKTVSGGWTTVWQDGSTDTPPPLNQPPFEQQPWNNRLPFFDNAGTGALTSDWGWRNLNGTSNFHGGIDISVANGTTVSSIDSGQVLYIKESGHDSGIVIGNSGPTTFTYWHITPKKGIKVGDTISLGQAIGTVASGGPEHLHYAHHQPPNGDAALRNDSNSRNPLP